MPNIYWGFSLWATYLSMSIQGSVHRLELIIEALMFLMFKSQEVVECSNSTKL